MAELTDAGRAVLMGTITEHMQTTARAILDATEEFVQDLSDDQKRADPLAQAVLEARFHAHLILGETASMPSLTLDVSMLDEDLRQQFVEYANHERRACEERIVNRHSAVLTQQRNREERRAYWSGMVWEQAGRAGRIAVADMTPNHAKNSLGVAERNIHTWARAVGWSVDELRESVLWRALEARAGDRATWSERRRDKASKKAWEARQARPDADFAPGLEREW